MAGLTLNYFSIFETSDGDLYLFMQSYKLMNSECTRMINYNFVDKWNWPTKKCTQVCWREEGTPEDDFNQRFTVY